jgi:hypothetical protein
MPYLLRILNRVPEVAAGPIALAVSDMLTLLLYFNLARWVCRIIRQRQDPCLLDTFISAGRYMEGAPRKPWWKYTAERKRELAARRKGEPVEQER